MSDFRLKAFYSVAKNLSFTRAAKELFVSQPAITKHINELERQYSVRLFDRTGGKIMLTDAGRLMLEHCSRILDEYNRMEYDMNLLNERSSGHISIGASTTVAQYVLPQILAEFTERFPQIEVSLTNGNSRDIENALLNHDIDLGSTEAIKAFLRHSRSMGIVSVFSVREELARGVFRVIDIAGLNFSRHFCFVASAGKDSPLTEKFKDFTRRSIITSGYRV